MTDPDGWFSAPHLISGSLDAALEELEHHNRESGFIKDDLAELQRHVFEHPDDPELRFRIQYNPKRAKRFEGAGVRTPPPNTKIVNDGCFLCRENISWQQKNTQVGLKVGLTDGVYHALMNPFPLMPNHLVIADESHVSQEWTVNKQSNATRDLQKILADLCRIASGLPQHIGFYNGVGAGASIPTHLHFQFFQRLPTDPLFPLEQRKFHSPKRLNDPEFSIDYPVEVARWTGDPLDVAENATRWISDWVHRNSVRCKILSSNFIASGMALDGKVTLYFIPRNRKNAHFKSLSGLVGGLEILGELVLSSHEDKKLLQRGQIDYFFCERELNHVHTPFF